MYPGRPHDMSELFPEVIFYTLINICHQSLCSPLLGGENSAVALCLVWHGANWNHQIGFLNWWMGVVLLCFYMSKAHAFGGDTEGICNFFTVQVAEHRDSAQRGCGVSFPGISKMCLGTVLSSVLWGILPEQGGWTRWPPVVPPAWPTLWWGWIPAEVQAILSDHPEENSSPAQAALAEQLTHGVGVVTLDFHMSTIPRLLV